MFVFYNVERVSAFVPFIALWLVMFCFVGCFFVFLSTGAFLPDRQTGRQYTSYNMRYDIGRYLRLGLKAAMLGGEKRK